MKTINLFLFQIIIIGLRMKLHYVHRSLMMLIYLIRTCPDHYSIIIDLCEYFEVHHI